MAALLDVSRQFHFNEEAWKNGEYYNANKVSQRSLAALYSASRVA